MARIFGPDDVQQGVLAGRRIAILGYGSQGRAQALNLRDGGHDVVVGLRPDGASWRQALADGWQPLEPAAAVPGADIVVLLVPDMAQPELFRETVATRLDAGATVLFSHGFNVHYGLVEVPDGIDVVMVAPKSPGNLLREQFEAGRGVPCLVAVHREATGKALARTLAYADGLGCLRAGAIETTFAEETETDLFGEQAVLCGGVTELIVAGWETLVEAGYQPEVAYFECMNEMKLIVDLLYDGGFAGMHRWVSDTASYGDVTRGGRVIDDHVRGSMRRLLDEVRSGTFAREWIREAEEGGSRFRRLQERDLEHPLEEVGERLRSGRAWHDTQRQAATAPAGDPRTP